MASFSSSGCRLAIAVLLLLLSTTSPAQARLLTATTPAVAALNNFISDLQSAIATASNVDSDSSMIASHKYNSCARVHYPNAINDIKTAIGILTGPAGTDHDVKVNIYSAATSVAICEEDLEGLHSRLRKVNVDLDSWVTKSAGLAWGLKGRGKEE